MGQFLQSPDPAIKLARQYGIRGLFSPDLVPSIQPVVIIDNLVTGISNEPQRISTAFISETGVAAETTQFRFEVPSNVIAHVTGWGCSPESNTFMNIGFGSTFAAPASLATSVYTDGRLRGAGQQPAGILGSDTYAVAMSNIQQRIGLPNSNSLFIMNPVNWIIGRTDGNFDFIEFSMANVDLNGQFWIQWKEFDAELAK